MEGATAPARAAKGGCVAAAAAVTSTPAGSTLAAAAPVDAATEASAGGGGGVASLPEPLAVRRIELSWVREQRRRARRVDGAAIHIQRIYRGRLGRRRFVVPNGGHAGGGAAQDGSANMLATAAPSGVMTAASYHRQKLRATKQRADGWRPPGLSTFSVLFRRCSIPAESLVSLTEALVLVRLSVARLRLRCRSGRCSVTASYKSAHSTALVKNEPSDL